MTSKTAERVNGSFNSFGSTWKQNTNCRTCNSQPFVKPEFCIHKSTKLQERLREKFFRLFPWAKAGKEPKEFCLDESRLILTVLAAELDRIMQTGKHSLSAKITEERFCSEERQAFILQWADDVRLANTQETGGGMCCPTNRYLMEEKMKDADQITDTEQRLTEARMVLNAWALSLKDRQQVSVCLDEDVCGVLQDLQKQWKKGKLANMLPVMDFIIWNLLQDTQECSAAEQWHRSRQYFRRRVAQTSLPESIWKWIIKAAADIRLDPSTANPNLELSADRKSVKMCQIIEAINNPFDGFCRTKSQFDSWWCVLGAEGYDSGRHYWEVDVSGKTEWRIGVMTGSAPRNGFLNLNTTIGYWTLRLQLGQLMATTSPITKLNRPSPNSLGVFLDLEEGQVSFYDAGKRCHIYTFDISYDHKEKIFPVFGTIETDKELKIVI
ncbi:E3 ubiquitin-protein ligase TRIM39-like [Lampris incognitus]|uniref:E3 ubiquitin-protein ligase TRIM39-like n=1 Tax=Lampris incognitus TaxID=2546036 RepID=UPI0024B50180|nr:E3 ubiquitin-protein ligase TRIM39-like [Lampris incognitus]